MSIAQQHIAELLRYREEHPDVDWDNNTYVCEISRPDLTLTVTGHRLKTQADRDSERALDFCCCHPGLLRHHDPVGPLAKLKLAFNRRFKRWRLCLHAWCWRVQTYQYRCHKHQGDK